MQHRIYCRTSMKSITFLNKVSFLHHKTLLSISMPRYPLMQYMINVCCIYICLMPSPVAFTVVSYVMSLCAVCTLVLLVMVPVIWLCVSDCLVCCRLHLFSYDALQEWLRFSSEAGTGHPATVASTTVCSCGVTCDQAPPSEQDGVKLIYLLCLLRGKMIQNWYTCC